MAIEEVAAGAAPQPAKPSNEQTRSDRLNKALELSATPEAAQDEAAIVQLSGRDAGSGGGISGLLFNALNVFQLSSRRQRPISETAGREFVNIINAPKANIASRPAAGGDSGAGESDGTQPPASTGSRGLGVAANTPAGENGKGLEVAAEKQSGGN